MTDWTVVIPILSALVGTIVGGFVVHLFTARRELLSTRRAQRVEFLILAYRNLIDASNRGHEVTVDQYKQLESALSDIMLLGNRKEVDTAGKFMQEMAEGGGADLHEVITALRDSLRTELGLSEVPLPHMYNLRMKR